MLAQKILKLSTRGFRNLNPGLVEFTPHINCIFGDNGNGKTNVLEAIYFLGTRRSFRKGTTIAQMISMDADDGDIQFQTQLQNEHGDLSQVSAKISGQEQVWYVDGRPGKRGVRFPLVFINPFDSYGLHTTASFRRHWFDSHLSQMDDVYRSTLAKYTRVLRMRNTLLSERPGHWRDQLSALASDWIRYSVLLTEKRLQFVQSLGEHTRQIFHSLFSENHELQIRLHTKLTADPHHFFREIQVQDENQGHTSYGVHLDDYVLQMDGINAYEYCSLGQQKMGYLSLNFAYIELFRYKCSSYPIVLIDDVSGELDRERWKRLIDYLKAREFQVFITTANDSFRQELEQIDKAQKLLVTSGSINRY